MIETCTGHRGRQFDHPTFGSWVSYALGSANKNLPTFVNIGRPSSPVQLTGGYLGASVAATPFQPGATPIPNLSPPRGGNPAERERQMQTLLEMNREFREHYAVNSDIAARTKAYELAALQLSKTIARGSAEAIRKSYMKFQNRLKTSPARKALIEHGLASVLRGATPASRPLIEGLRTELSRRARR